MIRHPNNKREVSAINTATRLRLLSGTGSTHISAITAKKKLLKNRVMFIRPIININGIGYLRIMIIDNMARYSASENEIIPSLVAQLNRSKEDELSGVTSQ